MGTSNDAPHIALSKKSMRGCLVIVPDSLLLIIFDLNITDTLNRHTRVDMST